MRTELLGQEKNIVRVKLEFEAGEFTARLKQTIREVAQNINVPGFRKGHAPRNIIEMRVGKDNLYKEAVEEMLPDALDEVVRDYELKPIATPSVALGEITEGQPLTVEAAFEVVPEVRLPELGDIEVEKLRPVVTDELFEKTLRELKKNHATLNAVERPIQEDDVVQITSMTLDGETQHEDVDLGDFSMSSEAKAAFLGKNLGDTFTFKPSKPEDEDTESKDIESEEERQDEEDAENEDADASYSITVDKIEERIWPEMTPEFYKEALGVDLESQEAFEEELRKRIRDRVDENNSHVACDAAIDAIVAKSELEVPDTILNRQIRHEKKSDAENIQNRLGIDLEEFFKKTSISPAQYEQQVRSRAAEIVRRTLVLDEIGDKFDVTTEKEELESEIDRRAEALQVDPAKVRAFYYKNENSLMLLADQLRHHKISKLILEKVKVRDVDELSKPEAESAESTTQTEGVV